MKITKSCLLYVFLFKKKKENKITKSCLLYVFLFKKKANIMFKKKVV